MSHTHSFRYDTVGSFLRPDTIKQAREKFADGEISQADLRAVEDEAIVDLIQQQEKVGLKTITDGEFRRSWWHLDFFWGLNGVEKVIPKEGYGFAAQETRVESAQLTGELSGLGHPFVDHYRFAKDHASAEVEVKQTIPAPAQFLIELYRPENIQATRKFYPTDEELIDGIANAYQDVIRELYDAGLRTIQLDDCSWSQFVGENHTSGIMEGYEDEANLKELFVQVNNKAIADLPEDLQVNTHVCRGNYISTWFAAGGYDNVADPLFTREDVDVYYLEYDSDRAGTFEPLEAVPNDKKVVLGLVTSKTGDLEDRATIIERIHEAAQYHPLENLSLSPQCGFSSTEEGNKLTEDQQWAKLQLINDITREVWG